MDDALTVLYSGTKPSRPYPGSADRQSSMVWWPSHLKIYHRFSTAVSYLEAQGAAQHRQYRQSEEEKAHHDRYFPPCILCVSVSDVFSRSKSVTQKRGRKRCSGSISLTRHVYRDLLCVSVELPFSPRYRLGVCGRSTTLLLVPWLIRCREITIRYSKVHLSAAHHGGVQQTGR